MPSKHEELRVRVLNVDTGRLRETYRKGSGAFPDRGPREAIVGNVATHVIVLLRDSRKPVAVLMSDYAANPGRYIHPMTLQLKDGGERLANSSRREGFFQRTEPPICVGTFK